MEVNYDSCDSPEPQSSLDREGITKKGAGAIATTPAGNSVANSLPDGEAGFFGDLESPEGVSLPSKKRRYSEITEAVEADRAATTESRDSVPVSDLSDRSGADTYNSPSDSHLSSEIALNGRHKNCRDNSGQPRVQYFTRRWDYMGGYKVSETGSGVQVSDIATLRTDDSVFAVILENNHRDSPHRKIERLEIWNTHLRESLQEILRDLPDTDLGVATPALCPKALFVYLDDIESQYDSLAKKAADGESEHSNWVKKESLKLLINYLKTKFATTIRDLELLLDRGLITFEYLWTLWKPGMLLFSPTLQGLEIPSVSMLRRSTQFGNEEDDTKSKSYFISSKFITINGNTIKYEKMYYTINKFPAAVKITSLHVYPLKYHKNEAHIRTQLLKRGEKYMSLQGEGIHQKSFTGIAAKKYTGDGCSVYMQRDRIVIDAVALREVAWLYEAPPGTTKAPSFGDEEDEETLIDGIQLRSLVDMLLTNTAKDIAPGIQDGGQSSEDDQYRYDENEGEPRLEKAKKTVLLMCYPFVTGYSLAHWEWLMFPVSGIEEVKWNGEAWDSLVLEQETKDIILTKAASADFGDVEPANWQGLTIMLYGLPGTGKTFAVEALADHLQRPLVKLSPASLELPEETLDAALHEQNMLDVCQRWGAVVLIDDASELLSLLEGRPPSLAFYVVLRHLKSPKRVMFLTSNPVGVGLCKDLYKVRISLPLWVGNPSRKDRMKLFQRFLDQAKASGQCEIRQLTEEEARELSHHDFNGREIQCVVKLALDWGLAKKETVDVELLEKIAWKFDRHKRDFKGVNWQADGTFYS